MRHSEERHHPGFAANNLSILKEPCRMTTLLDETNDTGAATRLRATMAAVRVCFTWLGVVRLMYPV